MAADWQKIRQEYDRSVLEWDRIQTYARKVAAEKRRPGCPKGTDAWVLDTRYWHRESPSHKGNNVTESEILHTLLLYDGSLVQQVVKTTETSKPFWISPEEATRHPFTARDALVFDFDNPERGHSGVVTNREPGRKLLVHAKGVGLSKLLKQLLQNPRPQSATPPKPPRRPGTSPCCGADIVRSFWGSRRCSECGKKLPA